VDGTLHQYNDDYNNGIDGMDARKFFNSADNLSIMSGGKDLIIERRQPITHEDTVFYRLKGISSPKYQLEFVAKNLSANGLQGFAEDIYLHTTTPLNLEGVTKIEFSVTSAAGSYAPDRFRVVFKTAVALPVTFVSLKAYNKNADIAVEWKVENESNMKHYEVEKATDGINFTKMMTLAAINTGATGYSWLDQHPNVGYNYYRIRSVDVQGKANYTQVVKVLVTRGTPQITIHPNPITDGIINLHLINQPAGMYGIRLLNPAGQLITGKQITHADGSSTEKITWDYKLARGLYHLEVTKPDGKLKIINVMY
jgi:hypothetical protein